MFKLKNRVQEYQWGKRDWLPSFLNVENGKNVPFAEFWMGAHPKASSLREEDGRPLVEILKEEGRALLGPDVYNRYGRLPFLFKILAVEEPLSIQVHPSKNQAEEGFARENGLGIPLDAFNRNYRDDNHKPEIICAVTPYTAMKGFRPLEEIRKNFLYLTEKTALSLFKGKSIRDFYFTLMGLDRREKDLLLDTASRWDSTDPAVLWVRKLMNYYPGDISALAPLFLNLIELVEGEALFLPAGELHAYLSGVGIELMANSDNVLRGGLTPKFMDLKELEKIVRFESTPVEILRKGRRDYYPSDTEEFRLGEKVLNGEYVPELEGEAAIVLIFGGPLTFSRSGHVLSGRKGDVIFIPRGRDPVRITGTGQIFWATVRGRGDGFDGVD